MNKNQAMALVAALEARKMSCAVALTYDAQGTEIWSVSLPPTVTYFGPDIGALSTYCQTNGLTLSIIVDSMGVT